MQTSHHLVQILCTWTVKEMKWERVRGLDDVIVEGAMEEEEEGGNEQVDVMDCIEGMLEFATQTGGRGQYNSGMCHLVTSK